MSDPVIIALIAGIQSTVTAILAAWVKKSQDANHQESMDATEVVRKDVNGKMNDYLRVSGAAEKAKGNLEGRAEEKAEKVEAENIKGGG